VNPKERDDRLILAASRGVLEGFGSDLHLGAAFGKYRYGARTFEGDAFETAFLWARQEREDRIVTQGASAGESETPLRAREVLATIRYLFQDAENRINQEKAKAPSDSSKRYGLEQMLMGLGLARDLVAVALEPKPVVVDVTTPEAAKQGKLDLALRLPGVDLVEKEIERARSVHGYGAYVQGMEKALELLGFKKGWTCPKCGRVSHNPNDAANNFCGVCGFVEGV
jgi:hypothetical protein